MTTELFAAVSALAAIASAVAVHVSVSRLNVLRARSHVQAAELQRLNGALSRVTEQADTLRARADAQAEAARLLRERMAQLERATDPCSAMRRAIGLRT